ncbi:MAG: hypothetical protein ACI8W8_001259 [Rhodothermales bacterium]|jgi:hypothetical protein
MESCAIADPSILNMIDAGADVAAQGDTWDESEFEDRDNH